MNGSGHYTEKGLHRLFKKKKKCFLIARAVQQTKGLLQEAVNPTAQEGSKGARMIDL